MQAASTEMSESFSRRRSVDNRVCRFFISWRGCREGNKCRFLHPMNVRKCKFYGTNRGCRSGRWCRYLHGNPLSPPDTAAAFLKRLDQTLGSKTTSPMIEECYLERADDAEDENAVEYHGPDRRSRGTQTDRQPEFIYCGECGEEFKYGRTVYQSLQRHYIDKLASADYQHLRFFKCTSQLRRNDAYCIACGEWFRSVEGLLQHMGTRVAGISVSSLQAEHQNFFKKLTEPFVDRDLSLSGAEYDIMGSIRKLYFVEREEVPVGEVEREGVTSKVKVAQKKEGTIDVNNNEVKDIDIKCSVCNEQFSEPDMYDKIQRHYMEQFGRACYDHIKIFKRNKDLQGEVSCAACGKVFAAAVGLLQHLKSKLDSIHRLTVESHRIIFWIITDPFVERDLGLITGKESVIVEPLIPIFHRHLQDSPSKKSDKDFSVRYKKTRYDGDESLQMAEYFSTVNTERSNMTKKEYEEDERERSLHEGFTQAEVEQLHSEGIEPDNPEAFKTLNVLKSSSPGGPVATKGNRRREPGKALPHLLHQPVARKDSMDLYGTSLRRKSLSPPPKERSPNPELTTGNQASENATDDINENAPSKKVKKKRPKKRKGSIKDDVDQEVAEDSTSEKKTEDSQCPAKAENIETGQGVKGKKDKVAPSPKSQKADHAEQGEKKTKKNDNQSPKVTKGQVEQKVKGKKGNQIRSESEQGIKPKKIDQVGPSPKAKRGDEVDQSSKAKKNYQASPSTVDPEKPKPKREKKSPRWSRRRSSTEEKPGKDDGVNAMKNVKPGKSLPDREPVLDLSETTHSGTCPDNVSTPVDAKEASVESKQNESSETRVALDVKTEAKSEPVVAQLNAPDGSKKMQECAPVLGNGDMATIVENMVLEQYEDNNEASTKTTEEAELQQLEKTPSLSGTSDCQVLEGQQEVTAETKPAGMSNDQGASQPSESVVGELVPDGPLKTDVPEVKVALEDKQLTTKVEDATPNSNTNPEQKEAERENEATSGCKSYADALTKGQNTTEHVCTSSVVKETTETQEVNGQKLQPGNPDPGETKGDTQVSKRALTSEEGETSAVSSETIVENLTGDDILKASTMSKSTCLEESSNKGKDIVKEIVGPTASENSPEINIKPSDSENSTEIKSEAAGETTDQSLATSRITKSGDQQDGDVSAESSGVDPDTRPSEEANANNTESDGQAGTWVLVSKSRRGSKERNVKTTVDDVTAGEPTGSEIPSEIQVDPAVKAKCEEMDGDTLSGGDTKQQEKDQVNEPSAEETACELD